MNVYAYGNVDSLHGIFNAIAMTMGGGDFAAMVRLAVVIGFAVVATLAAVGQLQKGWNWFLAVAVITSVMLLPKTTVTIEDRTRTQAPVVVANVPWSLALMAHLKSAIGATLTELFETAFQTIPSASRVLPAELSYQQHGMMFGSRIVAATRDAVPMSQYDSTDLVNYIRSCVLPEQGRVYSADQWAESRRLVDQMGATNPALSASYHDPGNGWRMVTAPCPDVWTALQGRLNSAALNSVQKAAASLDPALFQQNRAAAVAKVDASIPAAYAKASLAAAGATSAEIMLQNILINATADAAALQGAALNDPATLMMASMRTQALAQMNAGNMVQGRTAEESLPLIRNITEAILLAAFPILVILLVASEPRAMGGLFKGYVYTLIWVELWPPMFAIVNYLQTLEASKQLAAAALTSTGPGLAISTASAIYATSVSSLSTAAWMVTFVPVIAAACLFGFDRMMTITGATAGGQKAAQGEAAAATKGNLAMGNVSFMQQQLAGYRSEPTMYRSEGVGGVEFGGFGVPLLSQFREASAPVTLEHTAAITRGIATEASASVAAAQRSGQAYERSVDAAFGAARAATRGYQVDTTRRLGFDVSALGTNGLDKSEVDQEARAISERAGIADSSAVSRALGVGTHGLPIPVVRAEGSTQSSEQLQAAIEASAQKLRQLGTGRKQAFAESFRSDEAFAAARASNRGAAERVDSSLREATGFRETETREVARGRQLAARAEAAERFARQSTARWNNLLDQYARAEFGVSVHDGVADPRRWQQIVRSFIESGSIRADTDDGRMMWIPPDASVGPNQITLRDTGLQGVIDGGAPAIERAGAAALGAGRGGVVAAKAGYDGRESAREQQLGVAPGIGVSGADVITKVKQGQASAARTAVEGQAAVHAAQGEAQARLNNRADNTSPSQRLTGESSERARHARHGQAARPFAAEGEAAAARRAEEDAKFRADVGKAQIPTGPPLPAPPRSPR